MKTIKKRKAGKVPEGALERSTKLFKTPIRKQIKKVIN